MDGVLIELTERIKQYSAVERVVLFGSRARGDFTERSDYDVAVYGKLSDSEKAELRYFCDEELRTLHKVDLIFMCNDPEEKLIGNIEKDGKIIYDKV